MSGRRGRGAEQRARQGEAGVCVAPRQPVRARKIIFCVETVSRPLSASGRGGWSMYSGRGSRARPPSRRPAWALRLALRPPPCRHHLLTPDRGSPTSTRCHDEHNDRSRSRPPPHSYLSVHIHLPRPRVTALVEVVRVAKWLAGAGGGDTAYRGARSRKNFPSPSCPPGVLLWHA